LVYHEGTNPSTEFRGWDTKGMQKRIKPQSTESTEEVTEKGDEGWTTDYTDGHG